MNRHIRITFDDGYSHILIRDVNGVTHETTASKMPDLITGMNDDQRELIRLFCQTVVECIDGNCKRLNEW